ncbi:ATP-binding cassette domain-containing protein [Pacificimonas sp. WHA3]|uniref:ATP-binding cassette domain-containing protein n=1 Tax=Pacificimonas pallii TaxID=2827236 RepID=A0ABS6SD30_9SPHN|nr:ATP-binding cassette domain-containing protein [Pacificimonas pallii]MBV7256319.1 ATP-binding cassette domain-containing protein [Pacificimonas pallii]
MYSLQNISVSYGTTIALRPVSMEVEPGKTLVLIGPSGSGKSTLLRVMAGLVTPEGVLAFGGAPVTDWQRVRRRIGYVIQDGGLFPHLTARENILLMSRELGLDNAARVEELAALTHLQQDQLDRYPAELSGGQRQRVGIVRALMLDPDVLLLDEPLSALDPVIRAGLADELKNIIGTLKKTAVLVTHSLSEARFFSDRLVLMRGGAVVQEGSYADFEARPADPFVTEFIDAERKL